MPRIALLLGAIASLNLLGVVPGALAGEAELSRVKSELPPAARRLEEMFSRVRGTARMWEDNPRASTKTPVSEDRFAIDHGMEKVDVSRVSRGAKPVKLSDIVYCVGKGTAFHLIRRNIEQPYVIKGLGKREEYAYISEFGRFVNAHRGVLGHSLNNLLDSPDFKITGAQAIDQAGKNLLRVDCVFGPMQMSLDLDPAAEWIVRSGRFHPSDDPRDLTTIEIEYGPAQNGVPLPRKVRFDWSTGLVHHCEFTEWTFAPTPSAEFSMTYYGLPDIVHADRSSSVRAYWLAGIALFVGSIALLFWRFGTSSNAIGRA
jgi:hypothetical protein